MRNFKISNWGLPYKSIFEFHKRFLACCGIFNKLLFFVNMSRSRLVA